MLHLFSGISESLLFGSDLMQSLCVWMISIESRSVNPSTPVAATDRGRRVLVGSGATFEVANLDFTKFGIIPSVIFIVNIPEDVKESWYDGRVIVGMKEAIF